MDTYRPDIDGLRALAVAAVIINHVNSNILPSGYAGVDIFFVISGYVITRSIRSHLNKSFGAFIVEFYARRARRLVPALLFLVLIASWIVALIGQEPTFSLRTAQASIFGLSNIYLYYNEIDYFSKSTLFNAFAHTWSLGVEEQYYIIYPLLFWLLARYTVKNNLFIISTLIVLTIISFVSFLFFYSRDQAAAYYLMPFRFWEIGFGCLININHKRFSWSSATLSSSVFIALIILILLLPLKYGYLAIPCVVFLAGNFIASPDQDSIAHRFMKHKVIVGIGRISYSLYLWHMVVIYSFRLTLGINAWTIPLLVLIMLFLANISYKLIEQPFRKNFKWIQSGSSLVATFSGLVLTYGSLYILSNNIELFRLEKLLQINTTLQFDETWWLDKKGNYTEFCHIEREFKTNMLQACLKRHSTAAGNVFVIGDSHARNYVPAIKKALIGMPVSYLTMGWGCSFLPPGWIKMIFHVIGIV